MIPIIAMSAKDAREDMDACKEAGMNDYLAKPVEPQRISVRSSAMSSAITE